MKFSQEVICCNAWLSGTKKKVFFAANTSVTFWKFKSGAFCSRGIGEGVGDAVCRPPEKLLEHCKDAFQAHTTGLLLLLDEHCQRR